jgi:SAM-dependent methyltransferase
MTETCKEQLEFFSSFSRRVIDFAGAELLRERNIKDRSGRCGLNHLGTELNAEDLQAIEQLFAGKLTKISAYREAQIRELAFWRWVAYEGYDGKDPRFFPLHQEHFMVSTFYRTGWSRTDFRHAHVLELGCGPLGMIEYIPAMERVAFDPLNPQYSRLFARFRSPNIRYQSERSELSGLVADFDLGICHNVIDHTDRPDWWFDTLFSKVRLGGRFLFQVNLTRHDVPQTEEHRRMHPSPFVFEQVMEWLAAKSGQFSHIHSDEPSVDGEFYFLAWGTKTQDKPVHYENRATYNVKESMPSDMRP